MVAYENAEVAFFNGKIITLDPSDTIASAVAVKDGRILTANRSDQEIRMISDSKTQVD